MSLKKVKLSPLKIRSFVTSLPLDNSAQDQVKGGAVSYPPEACGPQSEQCSDYMGCPTGTCEPLCTETCHCPPSHTCDTCVGTCSCECTYLCVSHVSDCYLCVEPIF